MNDPNKIDNFYEFFNSSRCKTAMLILTCLIFFGIVVAELINSTSPFMQYLAVSILGYWTGRSTKAKENELNQ